MPMEQVQLNTCDRYGAAFSPPNNALKAGISDSALRGEVPLHGLRHQPESGPSCRFIWSGSKDVFLDDTLPAKLNV